MVLGIRDRKEQLPIAQESLQNLETLFQSALWVISREQEIIFQSPSAQSLFELSNTQFNTGKDFTSLLSFLSEREYLSTKDKDALIQHLTDSAPSSKSYNTKLKLRSGRALRLQLIKNTDGTFFFSGTDISSEHRNTDVMNLAMKLSSAGYWILSPDGSSLDVHSDYLKTILTAEEFYCVTEQGIWPFVLKEDLPHAEQLWRSIINEGVNQEGTIRFETKRHGIRCMRFHLQVHANGTSGRKDIICFFNDVTDQLRQNEELRKDKEEAERHLKEKNDFLARMSHEIRTPMNGVIGVADALIHHHANPEITEKLELIQSSANSILRILDETLDHTKLGAKAFSLNPELANPAKVVRDVCKLWEQQALTNGCFIRCIIKPDVPEMINFDRYRYEQCVNNLLSNAVKFTPKGNIDVVLMVTRKADRPARLVLAVRDKGIGMSAEQQKNIFNAFTQGDESITSRFGGTGLGMNITKQIIELMGGTITVKSELDRGSIFALAFPFKDSVEETAVQPQINHKVYEAAIIEKSKDKPQTPKKQEEQKQAIKQTSNCLVDDLLEAAQPETTPYSNLKILVVDDNATNHIVVNSLLESMVGELFNANNGREALDVLDVTDIDIVLMDIHMPVMDGIEATIAIRSSNKPWKDVSIIALTADPQYQQKKLCLNIGMNEALAKPVKLNDLLQAIDNVIETRGSELQGRNAA